uniref:Uncharacterized protein n=1 Tax=Noctiluca scintillans TaxID=2966 RepID=A7WQ85_NOCSC|nr:unknown [Noctiluca scintillans]ABV22378.1 unknown [Noctiluca scintillans]
MDVVILFFWLAKGCHKDARGKDSRVLRGLDDAGVELENEGFLTNCVYCIFFVCTVEQCTRRRGASRFLPRRLSCRQLCVCGIVRFRLSVAWIPDLPMAGLFGMRPPPRGGRAHIDH